MIVMLWVSYLVWAGVVEVELGLELGLKLELELELGL